MYTDATAASTRPTKQQLAEKLYRRWQTAQTTRMPWLNIWQQSADYVRPSKQWVQSRSDLPTLTGFENLFDGTAISANMTMASGCMSRLTPAQVPWFSFDPPRQLKDVDEVKRWYAECTEIAIEALATSNFYTEIHECYLDRGAFGVCCLHTEGTMKHPLNFKAHDIGTYAFLNGADGRVDTVFRELEFTAREAAQVFRPEELPECVTKELQGNGESTGKHQFLHVVYPREDADRDGTKIDGPNKPIASVYMYVKDKSIVRISGYDEMPTIGSRYLRWGTGPYGISPAWQALPECRQLNDLQRNMDVLAEVAAFPRMLLPFDQEGEVDLRANGQTFFKDPNNVPREWMTQGRYDIGLERVKERQAAIKAAYHVELFQMWSAITKQMTAYEVSERAQEKVELFSPTFTMLSTELYDPLLKRVFALLLKQSVFPPPPEQAVYVNQRGAYAIPDPQIRYTSRLALALKAVQNGALTRVLGVMGPIMQVRPEVADNINFDKAIRDISLNEGVPTDWIPDEATVAQTRQARAEAQAQQQQMEQQVAGAETAAKLAKAGIIKTDAA